VKSLGRVVGGSSNGGNRLGGEEAEASRGGKGGSRKVLRCLSDGLRRNRNRSVPRSVFESGAEGRGRTDNARSKAGCSGASMFGR
jgi:hypothetical protein